MKQDRAHPAYNNLLSSKNHRSGSHNQYAGGHKNILLSPQHVETKVESKQKLSARVPGSARSNGMKKWVKYNIISIKANVDRDFGRVGHVRAVERVVL